MRSLACTNAQLPLPPALGCAAPLPQPLPACRPRLLSYPTIHPPALTPLGQARPVPSAAAAAPPRAGRLTHDPFTGRVTEHYVNDALCRLAGASVPEFLSAAAAHALPVPMGQLDHICRLGPLLPRL